MKFGTEKIKILRSGKRQITEGIELQDQERIRALGKMENYKNLGILESDTMKQAEMKEKISKEYLRRMTKPLET